MILFTPLNVLYGNLVHADGCGLLLHQNESSLVLISPWRWQKVVETCRRISCRIVQLHITIIITQFVPTKFNLELSRPRCVDQLCNQKNVLNIWSKHNYILSHRVVHTTTCFGLVYWPSSGCTITFTSCYTICAWGTVGGTRSRLTVVGGMALGSPWTRVNIICQCLL